MAELRKTLSLVFMDAAFFALAAAALFVFRKRSPQAERPYRTPGYPFVPLIFIGIMVGFVVNLVAERPVQSLAGVGFTLLGLPAYAFFFRKA